MKETLYPHEVVVKWFKAAPFLLCLSVAMVAVVTISGMIVLTAVMDDTPSAMPDLVYTDMAVANTVYQPSCFVIAPLLVVGIFILCVGWGLVSSD